MYEPEPPLTAGVSSTLWEESIVAVDGEIVIVGAALTVIDIEIGERA